MSEVISVRLDADARRALAEFEATGLSRSEAVRHGLRPPRSVCATASV